MTTRIGVMVRLRPQLDSEKKKGYTSQKVSILEETSEIVQQLNAILTDSLIDYNLTKNIIRINSNEYNGNKCYQFSKVIPESINQKECFEQTQLPEMINRVVEGFHSTIFAYGQTGSGKTYTMEGVSYENNGKGLKPQIESDINMNENMGIIPRTIIQTFETIKRYSRTKNRIYKIYNEKIYDLLNTESTKSLRIRWSKKDQFSVENLFVFQCENTAEALQLFHKGIKNKFMATHKLNAQSSRSHYDNIKQNKFYNEGILTLRVDSMSEDDPDNIISSKLELVDLAGSERASQTGVEGQNLKEAIEINRSLFTLRQVISALAEYFQQSGNKKTIPFVPYRDSKLTSLLKQSIGGNSYCLMIACLSPCDEYFEENISTLNYATQAGFITNQPIRNEDPRIKQINILKAKNKELIQELHKANEHIALLSSLTNQNIKIFGQNQLNIISQNKSNDNDQQQQLSPNRIGSNKHKQIQQQLFKDNEDKNENYDQINSSSSPSPSQNQQMRQSVNHTATSFFDAENIHPHSKDIKLAQKQIQLKSSNHYKDNILQPLNINSPIKLNPLITQSLYLLSLFYFIFIQLSLFNIIIKSTHENILLILSQKINL